MGLASVMQTALSGMSAAAAVLDVTANNLANANTNGFKASSTRLATQTPRTVSSGAGPTSSNGGANPVQIGGGVRIAETTLDVSQGTIAPGGDGTTLALLGAGLFILEGASGERLYARNGEFGVNAQKQLVTPAGQRVLGYGVDNSFQLDTTQLSPLTIDLGRAVSDGWGGSATITDFRIGTDGTITGKLSDGTSRTLGQIQVARFANPAGLAQREDNTFSESPSSGLPVTTTPGAGGSATITAGATELSNTDVGQSLVDTLSAKAQYQASAVVLEVSESLFDSLLNLGRAR